MEMFFVKKEKTGNPIISKRKPVRTKETKETFL